MMRSQGCPDRRDTFPQDREAGTNLEPGACEEHLEVLGQRKGRRRRGRIPQNLLELLKELRSHGRGLNRELLRGK